MATIKFFVRSQSNTSTIYIRFTANRNTILRRTTPLVIDAKYFNNSTGKVRNITTYKEKDKIQLQLNNLSHFIITQYNESHEKGLFIDIDWLQAQINNFFNLVEVTDLSILENYAQHYIDKLKLKTNERTGELGTAKATLTKYNTIKTKIEDFQKHTRKKYRLTDVDLSFRNDFLKYLLEVDKLSRNTAGRYLRFLKTICLDAQRSGQKVSIELAQIKGFNVKVDKIYLNFKELEMIENKAFKDERLGNAKDWLIIGCYIGQRVGDLLQLTSKNITHNGNLEFIELIQQKTKKRVSILVHPKVKEILDKRNGQFPMQYSPNIDSAKTIFNKLIKTVCKDAGITKQIQGAKIDPDTSRKKTDKYAKHELITSHICRRSFATNFYGDIPTPLLLNITGHSTEKEFLNYIGKTPLDYAEQMAMYWNIQTQKQEKQTVLRAVK